MSDEWELRELPWRLDSGDLEWRVINNKDQLVATFYVNHAIARWIVDRANDSWEAAMHERNKDLEDITWNGT
jgi:hypothetical protein